MTRKLMEVTNPPGRVVVVLEVRDITNINCLVVTLSLVLCRSQTEGESVCVVQGMCLDVSSTVRL